MKRFPWYALLIAAYYPLTLLAENAGEVGFSAVNRAVVGVLLGELMLLIVLKKVYGDWQKTGFVGFLLTILFLSYGHFYSVLEKLEIAGLSIGRHRYLLTLWIVLIVLTFYLTGKIKQLSIFEDVAKPISIALVVFLAMRLTAFYYMDWQAVREQILDKSTHQLIQTDTSEGAYPDVYYIILDAYGRSDALVNKFDVDNTDFLASLRSLGFYVASCSQSNYAHTHLSLASSLNYSYLDDLEVDFVSGNASWSDLIALIRNSAIRRFLEEKHYRVVAFETDYAWTEWRNADQFIEKEELFFSKNLTSFESLFLHTTIGAVAIDFGWILEPQQNFRQYELILSNLDVLGNLVEGDEPKFVFAHLVIPHPPFVFDENGRYRRDPSLSPAFENYTNKEYNDGYRRQVMFINTRILEVIESILSKSERQPIIIIQGDHGPSHAGEEARMSILNAIYLPGKSMDRLQADMTPVNTFRVILDDYFGQSLPILPDISYFSKNTNPFAFTVIPNECKP